MKWFGKRREASRPVLARGSGMLGALGEWPRNFEAQAIAATSPPASITP